MQIDEVRKAIRKQRNGGAVSCDQCDGISATILKSAINIFYNTLALRLYVVGVHREYLETAVEHTCAHTCKNLRGDAGADAQDPVLGWKITSAILETTFGCTKGVLTKDRFLLYLPQPGGMVAMGTAARIQYQSNCLFHITCIWNKQLY